MKENVVEIAKIVTKDNDDDEKKTSSDFYSINEKLHLLYIFEKEGKTYEK